MELMPLTPGEVRCPRCLHHVVANGWPLYRPDVCSPEHWANCIRNPESIVLTDNHRLKIMRALGVKWPKNRAVPTYPSTMAEWQVREADLMYDEIASNPAQNPVAIPNQRRYTSLVERRSLIYQEGISCIHFRR